MVISIEFPEYLVCPVCKEKINLDYNVQKTGYPKTSDMITMIIATPRLMRLKDEVMTVARHAYICNHCKGILGFSQ